MTEEEKQHDKVIQQGQTAVAFFLKIFEHTVRATLLAVPAYYRAQVLEDLHALAKPDRYTKGINFE